MKHFADEIPFYEPSTAFFPNCPPFRVKISSRSGSVRFCISPSKGMIITVPPGYDLNRLPELLASRRAWICHHWEKLCAREIPNEERDVASGRAERERMKSAWPACVDFAFTGEHFGIRYELGPGPGTARENLGIIRVRHKYDDWSGARAALELFLKRHAKKMFEPVLLRLAKEKGLSPAARLCVRFQKTRWGSCSSTGNINLNVCLLFLPREEAEYVFLHELCHRKHMNHSASFWDLLETVLPDAHRLDKRLVQAWRYVPRWLLCS